MSEPASIVSFSTLTEGEIAYALIIFVSSLTLVILLFTAFLRSSLIIRVRRRKRFLDIWRPIFVSYMMGDKVAIPELEPKYTHEFLIEWNSLYEKMSGIARQQLREFGASYNIAGIAAQLLLHDDRRQRLIGINSLGNVGDMHAWPLLANLAKSEDPLIALASIRSLLKINAQNAIKEYLPIMLTRVDWPLALVSKITREIEPMLVCQELSNLNRFADKQVKARLIQLMQVSKCTSISNTMSQILSHDSDIQIVILCLKNVSNPHDVPLVLKFLSHDDWAVRMTAATALGHIGQRDDAQHLIPLLSDKEWWVRYRAAKSLASLPKMTNEDLLKLRDSLSDRFAKDMITQALAERRIHHA